MIQKYPAGRGQRDPLGRTRHQCAAKLGLQIVHLPAERWLGGMQPLLGRHGQAAFLRDRDEIAKMTNIHRHTLWASRPTNKVFFERHGNAQIKASEDNTTPIPVPNSSPARRIGMTPPAGHERISK